MVVVVVHNHWIHYKDLLFDALNEVFPSFSVIFTSLRSGARLKTPDLDVLKYAGEVLSGERYEDANKWRCCIRLWMRLDLMRPDVIVVSGWYDVVSWTAWLWAGLHRVKMVLWSESNVFDKPRAALAEVVKRIYVRQFDAVHVYGISNKKYIERLGVDEGKIVVKGAVLDVDAFEGREELRPTDGPIRLVYVGRIAEEKNLRRMIEAFAREVKCRDYAEIELTIVGYGPLEAELRRLAWEMEIDGSIEFRGAVSQEDLSGEYSRHDVCILPSTSEPWGLVVNEAMCCGLPVAASLRCGCAADLVTVDSGWTFDPMEIVDIQRVLRAIRLTPRSRLREMGQVGRLLSRRYTAGECARRIGMSIWALR